MTQEGDYELWLKTGYLDLNERIRDRWANLGELFFNAYGIKQYFELEEALVQPFLSNLDPQEVRVDFEKWEEQKQNYTRSRNKGNAYSIPPVFVNLAGSQDFWLPTFEIKFRKVKNGSELPISKDSQVIIRFPFPLQGNK